MPKATGGTWQCTFDDQFDGSTLDRSRWVPQETATSGFHSGPECLVDDRDNVSVGNGVLTLTARKEASPFVCRSRKKSFTTQYTGGQVSTYGRFSQARGRFEVRARFRGMTVAGVQASLWMWPADPARWPLKEEIDIAEVYSKYIDRAIPFVHYHDRTNVTNHYCMISNLARFHIYALEWTPLTLKFIYDGRSCLVHKISTSERQRLGQSFAGPYMLALSQVLGRKTNAFSPASTPLPASTDVDYVRVWK